MDVFITRKRVNDLDHLKARLEATKKKIQRLKNNGGSAEQIEKLQEREKMIGFQYEWLIKPV